MKVRKAALVALTAPLAVAFAGVVAPSASTAQPDLSGKTVEYNVLVADGASTQAAENAVLASGGKVTKANSAAGLLTVTAPERGFTERVQSSGVVAVAARSMVIGHVPQEKAVAANKAVEQENKTGAAAQSAAKKKNPAVGMDPLDNQLWGLNAVRSDLARTKQPGDKRVLVGVIDTGIDASHPDIAPNFDANLSRNFTHDIPFDETGAMVDGPCEHAGCVDPATEDDGGHGTHVAGTIAAAADGYGISGVAPNVTLVNIRAGQDSGFFFLQPTVDALTYAGDAGIDVVNMSFFTDPWLFNCQNNPADTPEQQAEQRLVVRAVTRALDYAHNHGVSLVAALGNEHEDMGNPKPDATSPDYPAGAAHNPARTIDNSTCLTMPTEGPNVIGVSAIGPSGRKSDYSNYGTERISVAAPGGWFRDGFGTPTYRSNGNLILSAYPKNVGIDEGNIDPATGEVTPAGVALGVQKDCSHPGGVCGYYQFLQGTSMAAPHATGVVALIISQYGKKGSHGSFGLAPDKARDVLEGTAFKSPCPTPRTVSYAQEGRSADFDATCTGGLDFNGFYGHGVVDAWSAVTHGKDYL